LPHGRGFVNASRTPAGPSFARGELC